MRSISSRVRFGIAGGLAAAFALAVGELIAGLSPASVSLTEAVGGLAIDYVPPPVKDFAIAVFGIYDKLALIIGMVVVTVLLGVVTGMLAARRWWVAVGVFGLFGLLGAFSLSREPDAGWVGSIASAAVAAALALAVLRILYRLLGDGALDSPVASVSDSVEDDGLVEEVVEEMADPQAVSRRKFLVGAGAVLGLGVAMAAGGRLLLERTKQTLAGRENVVLPQATETTSTTRPPTTTAAAASPTTGAATTAAEVETTTTVAETTTTQAGVQGAGPLPAGHSLDVPDISPIITPNEDFYLIDIALTPPQVNLEEWRLKVTGLVENPYEITFDELLTRPLVERYVTLSCVSNSVGGSLVGHAKWLGVPLSLILDEAGLLPEAEQIVGRSVDGFTVGFPSTIPFDGRDALVAVGMNDEPLPIEHGFPVRLVVAGLYGYVSATKWLSELELTTWDGFDAYWVPRGWAKEAPVKTQSRIDTPRDGRNIQAGARSIAGVAWAPHRGVDRVEVQVDNGPWKEAELSAEISDNSWRQWRIDWDPLAGPHQIRCRATDGEGVTQTEVIRPPAPDGATGWHTIRVTVSA